jgi:cytochrome c553
MNTRLLIRLSLLPALLLWLQWAQAEPADDEALRAAAERVAVGTCATCHGPEGYSQTPKFPVLAGQHAGYLQAQLQAFRAQTRGDPDALGYMWGMAAPLDDAMMGALAEYYGHQAPRHGPPGDERVITRGKDVYQNGDAAQGVPACAACHGATAEGTEAFPRLAGQHVQYLIKQLRSFQNNMRNVAVMHGVARGLQLGDMEAIANYLQSLGP